MKDQNMFKCGLVSVVGGSILGILSVSSVWTVSAAPVAQYEMNSPTQLVNSAGATTYEPNLLLPASPNAPTHLANGGVSSTGAFQFDGVDDYLGFTPGSTMYVGLTLAQTISYNWTVSFWIKTTDTNSFTGYAGTPQIPVVGNSAGDISLGLGIDGGKATAKLAPAGWITYQGTNNVADGLGHYLTFVAVSNSSISIYVDGQPDGSFAFPYTVYQHANRSLGRSYLDGTGAHYGAFTLDDLRVWDQALTLGQIHDQIIPEPSTVALLAVGGFVFVSRRRLRV